MSFLYSRDRSGGGGNIFDDAINRWRFDEGSGTTVSDSIGADDGTINGATWQSGDGKGGYHLTFTGGDTVNTPAIPATGDSNRTFACWAKREVGGQNQVISDYGTDATGERWTFRLSSNSDGPRIELGGSGYSSNLTLTQSVWEPVAVVLDGSQLGDHTLYVDGTTESATGTDAVNTGSTESVQFGDGQFYTDPWDGGGGIDDPTYWGRALSISELDDWVSETQSNY